MITLEEINKASNIVYAKKPIDKIENKLIKQIALSLQVYVDRKELDITNLNKCVKYLLQAGYEVKGYESI